MSGTVTATMLTSNIVTRVLSCLTTHSLILSLHATSFRLHSGNNEAFIVFHIIDGVTHAQLCWSQR